MLPLVGKANTAATGSCDACSINICLVVKAANSGGLSLIPLQLPLAPVRLFAVGEHALPTVVIARSMPTRA
jgi:hypothetical protein